MTRLRITPATDAITYAQQNAANVEKHGLNCTDLSSCSDKGKLCKNMQDNDGDDDGGDDDDGDDCLLYTSPSPRDATLSRMPSSA